MTGHDGCQAPAAVTELKQQQQQQQQQQQRTENSNGKTSRVPADSTAAAEDREQQWQDVNSASRQHSSRNEFPGGSMCGRGSVYSRVWAIHSTRVHRECWQWVAGFGSFAAVQLQLSDNGAQHDFGIRGVRGQPGQAPWASGGRSRQPVDQ